MLKNPKTFNIPIKSCSLDLLLQRHSEQDVGINILKRVGEIEVVILK
jgi:hypothetical protein